MKGSITCVLLAAWALLGLIFDGNSAFLIGLYMCGSAAAICHAIEMKK